MHKMMWPFYRDLLSRGKEMFVDLDSWERLVEKKQLCRKRGNDEQNRIYFLSMLRPEPFLNAILLGANVTGSLVYRWLSHKHGCEFVEHQPIVDALRKLPDMGKRADIGYFVPGRNASKYLYSKQSMNGNNLLSEIERIIIDEFRDKELAYVTNNDHTSPLDNLPTARKLPVISHGLNDYANCHNIFISAALNRQPKHFEMLNSLGLPPDIVHRATAHETIYQCVMRTSLRDPNATEPVRVRVVDEPSARYLGEMLGATNIQQIGNLYAPPPKFKPLTGRQINRRHETLKVIDRLFDNVTSGGKGEKYRKTFGLSYIYDEPNDSRSSESGEPESKEHEEGNPFVTVHIPPPFRRRASRGSWAA
jgi:hypothetical protein